MQLCVWLPVEEEEEEEGEGADWVPAQISRRTASPYHFAPLRTKILFTYF